MNADFQVGDHIRVTASTLSGSIGTVEAINPVRNRGRVTRVFYWVRFAADHPALVARAGTLAFEQGEIEAVS